MKELLFAINPLQPIQDDFLVAAEKSHFSISNLFIEGGLPGMIVITLLLIALFIAAWKAPRWVKEIGIGALVFSIFWNMIGLYQALGVVQIAPDISLAVICGGLKVAMISLLYGLIVFFISLIIRIAQKPRI